jgi:DNA-binding transcriptional ArsR family regulator
MKQDTHKQRARILKAMAHPSRLAMLEALTDGERCVCDLQKLVGSDMSTVSKHLSVMKAAGLVEARKEGLWMHYRLRVPCVMQFMHCIEAVLNEGKTQVAECRRSA